jgi:uncharacterized protein (DUF1778 family)
MPSTASTQEHKAFKLNRVVARVPEEVKRRWQSAAAIRGQTLTDFLIVAANNATDEVFNAERRIELSERDQMVLAEMLLNPPELTEIMKSALKQQMAQMKVP